MKKIKKVKKVKRIDLSVEQVDALLKRAKELLPPEDYEILESMAETLAQVYNNDRIAKE